MLTCFSDTNSANISTSNTYDEWHEYEIDWTPDEIKWIVDGKVGRNWKREWTWNETSNQWAYPQTPSRVQISIWPAGSDQNAQGTIDWAGGKIDWNSDEIQNYGYYFATFGEISVKCYKTNSPPGTNKGISYYYNNIVGTNDTVVDSNKKTVLKSFLATGTDMDKGDGTATGGSAESSGVHAIPGGGTMNPGGNNNHDNSGSGSGGGSSGSGSGGSSSGGSTCDVSSFCQGGSNSGSNNPSGNDGVRGVERTVGASAFAVIVGIAVMLFL